MRNIQLVRRAVAARVSRNEKDSVDGDARVTAAAQKADVNSVTPSSLAIVHEGRTYTWGVRIESQVTATAASPTLLPQGATNQSVTVTGNSFASGATVSVSGTGVSVGTVNVLSGTQLTAILTVATNAPTGFRDVTVTNETGGSGTGAAVLDIVTRQDLAGNLCGLIASYTASGDIATPGIATSLSTSCENARRQIGRSNNTAVRGMLGAMSQRLDAFVGSGKVTLAARNVLVTEIDELLSALQ